MVIWWAPPSNSTVATLMEEEEEVIPQVRSAGSSCVPRTGRVQTRTLYGRQKSARRGGLHFWIRETVSASSLVRHRIEICSFRTCPGVHFAQASMFIAMATALAQCNISDPIDSRGGTNTQGCRVPDGHTKIFTSFIDLQDADIREAVPKNFVAVLPLPPPRIFGGKFNFEYRGPYTFDL